MRSPDVLRARQSLAPYARPAVAVDLVILTLVEGALHVLLIRRGESPFEGRLALPGGFLRVGDGQEDQGEDLDLAAARELQEETGLASEDVLLEQFATFGRPGRDPRMRVLSVAYYALVRPELALRVRAGGDAAETRWEPVAELDGHSLAFDHGHILQVALARMREKLDTSALAFSLVPERFTIPELRTVFSAVKGEPQDPGNFRRKVKRLVEDGVLEPAPGVRRTASKPAALYRFRAS
ncbi:NUDIX hydrolase [Melittangium boletus]|uniref:NUDIX domain-containing protein n=1 Tax=Melittangium boletus DSM 14713 TaxID=1294270 RepID=A0A250IA07_9BACT|nr:NUDIX domain-containing protein [Melittangium boletus]ATB27796.1 NUDIX domain-containing protein [Melittangium boletus DSM 14713]